MKIVNLTPHDVTVRSDDGTAITFEATGQVTRLGEIITGVDTLETSHGSIGLRDIHYDDDISNLPEPSPEVLYLVSRVTAAASDRQDLVFPHDEIRDSDGQIIGCRALGRFTDHSSSSSMEGDRQ